MVYRISGTPFRVRFGVQCIYQIKETSLVIIKKVEETQIRIITDVRVHPLGVRRVVK